MLPRTALASSIFLVCFNYWIYFFFGHFLFLRKPNLFSFSAFKHSQPIHLHVQLIRSPSFGPHPNCFYSPTFLFPHSQPIRNILLLSVRPEYMYQCKSILHLLVYITRSVNCWTSVLLQDTHFGWGCANWGAKATHHDWKTLIPPQSTQ